MATPDVTELLALMQKQHQEQIASMMQQFTLLMTKKETDLAPLPQQSAAPTFVPFDPESELWKDYWTRFETFCDANIISETRQPLVFLTNQTSSIFKVIDTFASQQTTPTTANKLSITSIKDFMSTQYDPKKFIIRERYKFWSTIKRKPGETVTELATRVRQMAATCDFPSITSPLDEALRTCFICAVGNEGVLKAIFRKNNDVDFTEAVAIASEVEEASKTAKAQIHSRSSDVNIINRHRPSPNFNTQKRVPSNKTLPKTNASTFNRECDSCGGSDHLRKDCKFLKSTCHYCKKVGHIASVCKAKKRSNVNYLSSTVHVLNNVDCESPSINVVMKGKTFPFIIDTGATCNVMSVSTWTKLGKPTLQAATTAISATGHQLSTYGTTDVSVSVTSHNGSMVSSVLLFTVTKEDLNLLGVDAINALNFTIQSNPVSVVVNKITESHSDTHFHSACVEVSKDFPDLWKPGLGCLKGVQLDVQFKDNVKPRFIRPRTVPIAMQDDLNSMYDAGIASGLYKPVNFNSYATPVVPIRKANGKLRICGDYSVFINSQLQTHRQPMPLPEDLFRKLGGGYFFSKIDLADAYHQIELTPESQKRLALSTHRGVLLQTRLPFGISSATGYFQDVMNQLTSDLPGVAVYLDDVLVSGINAEDHLNNLKRLLSRLDDNNLRCRLEKCAFAQESVTYLGHTLSRNGLSKGPKADAVSKMPPPVNVSQLRSFLGSVQFYHKFLPDLSTMSQPLHHLTKKNIKWNWGPPETKAFNNLKQLLSKDTVLAHFDPTRDIGISCDASDVGIGAVLFHRYSDGSERPIANVSKTLNSAQRNYSQIQKEALSIIFALSKYHHYLYGRKFILVTDHKPLLSLFGPCSETPKLAANRLARWALTLSQYDYTIEYRNTKHHGNADALSRLPTGPDDIFDGEEMENNTDTVCVIQSINQRNRKNELQQETNRDPTLSTVKRYTIEGWPNHIENDNVSDFKRFSESLSVVHDCLTHGNRVVIPTTMRRKVLDILHHGHFGMQRMKQLARSSVYWPRIDQEIEQLCRLCTTCGEHQNKPPKPANHPWMMPEKPWSRIHIDHAINFLGSNWLIITDAYSKYPIIHQTHSTSTMTTTRLLDEDFSHFGYPHSIVSDNATTFSSAEFKEYCTSKGISHLTGAPYHPATNGAAERLVQSFKQSMRKSSLPTKSALQMFLMQYRRTPLSHGLSPSELLNGRQIRTDIDVLLPSPAHMAQERQSKSQTKGAINQVQPAYKVGTPCYALYCGPRQTNTPRWVPAFITKVHGTRTFTVRCHPQGHFWKRHLDQLQPRYTSEEENEPIMDVTEILDRYRKDDTKPSHANIPTRTTTQPTEPRTESSLPEYGRHNPRRSRRTRRRRLSSL